MTSTRGERQTLRSIQVSTEPAFTFTEERSVSIGEFLSFAFYRSFDIMPDGERLLVVLPAQVTAADELPGQRLHVVQNWFEEIKERLPAS